MSNRSKLVLVVEDDADIRETVALVLGTAGYEVATASDGMAALAWLREHPSPSLILLDLALPGLEGGAVHTALRAEPAWARIPLVLCTAASDLDPRLGQIGNVPLLRKPFDVGALLEVVERHAGPHDAV